MDNGKTVNATGTEKKKRSHKKISFISILHYYKLFYRSILFILALVWYIYNRYNDINISIRNYIDVTINMNWAVLFIGVLYTIEMVLRLVPSKFESPGCQKQFKKNYIPTGRTDVVLHDNHAVVIVALGWVVLNGIIGALYMTHIIDEGILWLICLLYGICDMICILFFCPFQTWFLKNRCCVSCRIYNWDFAMMFTPLFFIPGILTWSLLLLAMIILIKWEIVVWRYPERFSENTNQFLACENCTERLCAHKKQLISFRKSLGSYAEEKIKRILMEFPGNKKDGKNNKE